MDEEKSLDEMSMEELETLLSPKQRRFVHEYERDWNATAAAIRAGYCRKKDGTENRKAAAVTGSRLLRDAKVTAYRHARTREIYKNLNLSRETVALRLVDVFNQCMQGYPHMVWNTATHGFEPDGTYNFDSRGATKALELLGRSLGMFEEKIKYEDVGGVEDYLKKLEEEQAAAGEFQTRPPTPFVQK